MNALFSHSWIYKLLEILYENIPYVYVLDPFVFELFLKEVLTKDLKIIFEIFVKGVVDCSVQNYFLHNYYFFHI